MAFSAEGAAMHIHRNSLVACSAASARGGGRGDDIMGVGRGGNGVVLGKKGDGMGKECAEVR